MSEFDLEVKGQRQTVKITFKAPSKGYVYLFFRKIAPVVFEILRKN